MHKRDQLFSVPFVTNSDTEEEGWNTKTAKQYGTGLPVFPIPAVITYLF